MSTAHPKPYRPPLSSFWNDLPREGRLLLSVVAFQFIGTGLVLPFWVVYLHEIRGFSLDTVGLLMALLSLAGFAVLGPGGARTVEADEPVRWSTDFGEAQLSHVNLYDRTVEGLTLLDVPGGTVQYHPEAGPGPHDSLYLFDRFLESVRA